MSDLEPTAEAKTAPGGYRVLARKYRPKDFTDLMVGQEPMVKTLTKFWKDNKGKEVEEVWFEGNAYTNHWEAPTAMMDVSDSKLKGDGEKLVDLI